MSDRMNDYKLNNDWFMDNAVAIVSAAPAGAVHALIDNKSVEGYYENAIDVMDALMLKKGAIIVDLDYTLLQQS